MRAAAATEPEPRDGNLPSQGLLPSRNRCGVSRAGSLALVRGGFAPAVAAHSRRRWLGFSLLGMALLYTIAVFVLSVGQPGFGTDFVSGPWLAGHAVFHGVSPYIRPHGRIFIWGIFFDYPAFAAVFFAPLSLLPATVAAGILAGVSILAVLLALRIVGVRDPRVYAIVLMWPPVIMGWQFGNPSLLLVLGAAVCWRYRDRAAMAGLCLALMISLKLFLWPLLIWLLATRRRAAAAYAVGATVIINVVSWGILGYGQITRFVDLLRADVAWAEIRGSGLVAFFEVHGASSTTAHAAIIVLALACGLAAVKLGRAGNDQGSFALGIGTALIATPLLWPHYYALLAVPLAIVLPRLTVAWGIPFLMLPAIITPTATPLLPTLTTIPAAYPAGWPIAVCLGAAVLLILLTVSRGYERAEAGLTRLAASATTSAN